jgi:predicted nucleic acid-binding Zn ribbon protein
MLMSVNTKHCLTCGHSLRGRTDKKFCDDNCRSVFNNKKHEDEKGFVKKVNHQLLKNRRILASYVDDAKGTEMVPKKLLFHLGFHFNYFTHTAISKEGITYYCCYDHAYHVVSEQELEICKLSKVKDSAIAILDNGS